MRDIQQDHRWYQEWYQHFHGDIVPLIVFDNGKQIIDGYEPKAMVKTLRELRITRKSSSN